jgi:hypothetical protein
VNVPPGTQTWSTPCASLRVVPASRAGEDTGVSSGVGAIVAAGAAVVLELAAGLPATVGAAAPGVEVGFVLGPGAPPHAATAMDAMAAIDARRIGAGVSGRGMWDPRWRRGGRRPVDAGERRQAGPAGKRLEEFRRDAAVTAGLCARSARAGLAHLRASGEREDADHEGDDDAHGTEQTH